MDKKSRHLTILVASSKLSWLAKLANWLVFWGLFLRTTWAAVCMGINYPTWQRTAGPRCQDCYLQVQRATKQVRHPTHTHTHTAWQHVILTIHDFTVRCSGANAEGLLTCLTHCWFFHITSLQFTDTIFSDWIHNVQWSLGHFAPSPPAKKPTRLSLCKSVLTASRRRCDSLHLPATCVLNAKT